MKKLQSLYLWLVVVMILPMSSCNLLSGSIPEIPVTLSLFTGTIPQSIISWDQPVTREFNIPQTCGKFNIEDLKNKAKEEIQKLPIGADMISKIIENIEIENLWFQTLQIVILEGNMPNITNAYIKLKVGSGEIELNQFQIDSSANIISLAGQNRIDLLPFIKDFQDGGCVEGTLYVTTLGPVQTTIEYEMRVKISIKVKV